MRTKPRFWETDWIPASDTNRMGICLSRRQWHSTVLWRPRFLAGENWPWYQNNCDSPQETGLKKPNRWGLFDMHGNAMEWCFDLYSAPIDVEQPSPDFPAGCGIVTSEDRELRGGAYYDIPKYVTSANRYHETPDDNLDSSGFRIARTLKSPRKPSSVKTDRDQSSN